MKFFVVSCVFCVWKSPDNDNVRIRKRRSSSLLKLLPKFACLNNSLNIYNLPIVKQSAPLSLHFPVQLRFFFRMNLCLLRFLSSSRATVKIRSHELPTDFVRFFPGYNALAESPILKPLLTKLWNLDRIRSMMTSWTVLLFIFVDCKTIQSIQNQHRVMSSWSGFKIKSTAW